MTQPRLLYMGGAVVDFVYRVPALPDPGGESLARSFDSLAGGGFNMMAAAAASGMEVAYGGQHGKGPYGDLLRAAMTERGIALLQPLYEALDSGTCVVMVTPDAERTFVSWPGAEGVMEKRHLKVIDPLETDWVFVSGYSLSYGGSGPALADWVGSLPSGTAVIFDPSPLVGEIPGDRLATVLQRADWLSCNQTEAVAIAGDKDAAAQADLLVETHCPRAQGLVMRAGAEGSFLKLRGQTLTSLPAFEVEAVDSNGAGDTHVGAFIAAVSRGADPLEAVRYANAAAAISVTREGGASAPERDEIERFLRGRAPDAARRAG